MLFFIFIFCVDLIFRLLFFCQAEDGIRDLYVTGVQTCALPICAPWWRPPRSSWGSTLARWSWSARSARHAALRRFCSASEDQTIRGTGYLGGWSTRPRATSWWNARPCCAGLGPDGSTAC